MTTHYAALLRGINVGGGRRVPMAQLRALLTGLGLGGVRTHLQSGNAVFTSDEDDGGDGAGTAEDRLGRRLADALEESFGFRVDCLVRSGAYLKAVADACPFPAAQLAGKQLHVTYFSQPVDPARFAGLDREAFLPEEFRLGDRALYLYAPGGVGRSPLADALARPAVTKGLIATSRNWNTVTKLVEWTHEDS